MKIKEHHIKEVLQMYGLKKEISSILFLHEGYRSGVHPRVKVIVKVTLVDKSKYIIKFVLEEEHSQSLIEEQSLFSECLRKNGIITAKRFRSEDKYATPYVIDELELTITVEEYLGEEIKSINYKIVNDMAILMAKMHKIAIQNNCRIKGKTIWDIFDNDSDIMRGYVEFVGLNQNKDIDFNLYNVNLYNDIITLYNERLDKLKSIWSKLPRYAVQGDYSINNLTRVNEEIGIFDYNIAGDEVLVSDMIIEGLFIAKEMDLCEELVYEDRDKLFKLFVETYMQHRKLTLDELSVMNDIYAVAYPFWWTRIIFDEEIAMLKLLKNKEIDKVNEFLKETYKILSGDYFVEDTNIDYMGDRRG